MTEIIDLENRLKFDQKLWFPIYGFFKLPETIKNYHNTLFSIGEEIGEEEIGEQQISIIERSHKDMRQLFVYQILSYVVGSTGLLYGVLKLTTSSWWANLVESFTK